MVAGTDIQPSPSDTMLDEVAPPGGASQLAGAPSADYSLQMGFHDENRGNYISTTKYKWYNFIFKNLAEQFRRFANVYFLVAALLSVGFSDSPIPAEASVFPLIFVLFVNMIKEGYEDYQRYLSDKRSNRSPIQAVQNGEAITSLSSDLCVGDVIVIRRGELIPADCVLLSTSSQDSVAYIETANLDGETSLKRRLPAKATDSVIDPVTMSKLPYILDAELPNSRLYHFEGRIFCRDGDVNEAVSTHNFLQRGAKLRNTKWIIGLVVYAGQDTKIQRNSAETPSRFSKLEKGLNRLLFGIFMFYAICVLGMSLGSSLWASSNGDGALYLDTDSALAEFGNQFIAYFILLAYMIPISLYVSMEVVRVAQILFMSWDVKMRSDPDDPETSVRPRNSNTNEELGQVEHIFSDKTGTLTCNDMCLLFWNIGSDTLNERENPGILGSKIKAGVEDSGSRGAGTDMSVALDPVTAQQLEFMKAIVTCHTVVPEVSDDTPQDHSSIAYSAESPDEEALIDAAVANGWRLLPSTQGTIRVMLDPKMTTSRALLEQVTVGHVATRPSTAGSMASAPDGEDTETVRTTPLDDGNDNNNLGENEPGHALRAFTDAVGGTAGADSGASPRPGMLTRSMSSQSFTVDVLGQQHTLEWELLDVLEFSSDRKRMSVIVREPGTGRIVLYCKGADSHVLPRLARHQSDDVDSLSNNLSAFSSEGLRTLVVASKELSPMEYETWAPKYRDAKASIAGREESVAACCELVEHDLHLLGCTAVEDKLQDGVPEVIQYLIDADIHIWLLTGDKMETAINIGFSSSLLAPSSRIIRMANITDSEEAEKVLNESLESLKATGAPDAPTSLVIDGVSLEATLDGGVRNALLLELSCLCKSVICCRVTPLQKALMVRMARAGLGRICLSIGDGANDVSMIQEANVGIGIQGKEGSQAALASDYAIHEFRHLQRLLSVHGRYSYLRLSILIQYSFYKNVAFILIQVWFAFFSGFTAQTLLEAWLMTGFNVIFTVAPPLALGIFEKDIPESQIEKEPRAYTPLRHDIYFNLRGHLEWIITAVFHSLIVYFTVHFAHGDGVVMGEDGQVGGLFTMGAVAATSIVSVVTFKVALTFKAWTWITHLVVWGSLAFLYLYQWFFAIVEIDLQYYHVFTNAVSTPNFWLTVILATSAPLLFDFAAKYYVRRTNPPDWLILTEREIIGQKVKSQSQVTEVSNNSSDCRPITSHHDSESP